MSKFNDFSQLKSIKPVQKIPEPKVRITSDPDERALENASSSCDYFSSLLGGGGAKKEGSSPVTRPRATVVTPATINRVRQEQVEAAREAERASFAKREEQFAKREAELLEEIESQKDATESIATDLATLKQDVDAIRSKRDEMRKERDNFKRELDVARRDIAAAREIVEATRRERDATIKELEELRNQPPPESAGDKIAIAERDAEIERLQKELIEAQRDEMLRDGFLNLPVPFTEKFPGEVREHVLDTLVAAEKAAEAGGRDRRARILEAVLGANPIGGELEMRRERVRNILKSADYHLTESTLAELARLGFRYVSSNKHYKLEWAGIRFPIPKTPSDYRACLNLTADICNRAF